MLNYKELADLDVKTLNTKLGEKRRELFELRMQKATSGLEKSHVYKIAKKDIAKIQTAISAKKNA